MTDPLFIQRSVQVFLNDPVDLKIRISSDGRGKMTVILACKTKMTDTLYGHGTIEYYDLEGRVIKTELFGEGNIKSSYYENKYGDYGITDEYAYDADGNLKSHGKTYYDEKGQMLKKVSVDEKGKETVNNTWEYDAYGNMIYHWGARGYETSAKYNEYGYPVWKHEVCNDPLRDAGTFDITTEYEYVYY